jgi:hypothetical protein
LLNLTHRESHEHPTLLEPGKRYTVTLRLNAIAHSIRAGHYWRVAISPTYWPFAWPSPEPVTLSLFTGAASRLVLPVRPPRDDDARLVPFAEPEGTAPLSVERLRSASRKHMIHHDTIQNLVQIVDETDAGRRRLLANGLEDEAHSRDTYTIIEGQPLSAHVRCDRMVKIGRGDWRTRLESSSTMSADAETFYVTNVLEAYEGEVRVFTKTWDFKVPRDFV